MKHVAAYILACWIVIPVATTIVLLAISLALPVVWLCWLFSMGIYAITSVLSWAIQKWCIGGTDRGTWWVKLILICAKAAIFTFGLIPAIATAINGGVPATIAIDGRRYYDAAVLETTALFYIVVFVLFAILSNIRFKK